MPQDPYADLIPKAKGGTAVANPYADLIPATPKPKPAPAPYYPPKALTDVFGTTPGQNATPRPAKPQAPPVTVMGAIRANEARAAEQKPRVYKTGTKSLNKTVVDKKGKPTLQEDTVTMSPADWKEYQRRKAFWDSVGAQMVREGTPAAGEQLTDRAASAMGGSESYGVTPAEINPPGTRGAAQVPTGNLTAQAIVSSNLTEIRKHAALAAIAAPFKALSPQLDLSTPENRRSVLLGLGSVIDFASGGLAGAPFLNDEEKANLGMMYLAFTVGGEALGAVGKKALDAIHTGQLLKNGLSEELNAALGNLSPNLRAGAEQAYADGGLKGLRSFADRMGGTVKAGKGRAANTYTLPGKPKEPVFTFDSKLMTPEQLAAALQESAGFKGIANPNLLMWAGRNIERLNGMALKDIANVAAKDGVIKFKKTKAPKPAAPTGYEDLIPDKPVTTFTPKAEPPVVPPAEPPSGTGTGTVKIEEPKPPGASAQNKATSLQRIKAGLADHPAIDPEHVQQWYDKAQAAGIPGRAKEIATKIMAGERGPLTHMETVGIATRLDELDQALPKLTQTLDKAKGKAGEKAAVDALAEHLDELDVITQAANRSGTEWGRTGVARQAFIKAQYGFTGFYARVSKAVDRPLTQTESLEIKRLSDALATVTDELAKVRAERTATANVSAGRVYTPRKMSGSIQQIRARRSAASERLKTKWAASATGPVMRSEVLPGLGYTAEQAARVANVLPEIIEIAGTIFTETGVRGLELSKAVVAHLKGLGVKDIEEPVVTAALGRQIRQTAQEGERAVSSFAAVRNEIEQAFRDDAAAQNALKRTLDQERKDIQKLSGPVRKLKAIALRNDRQKWLDAERARKQAEAAFSRDVRAREAEWRKGQKEAAREAKATYIKWFRDSAGGRRAQLMNRLDTLQGRLTKMREGGWEPPVKTAKPDDPVIRGLEVKEAALKTEADAYARQKQYEAALAKEDPWAEGTRFIADLVGAARTGKSTADISAPFFQGYWVLLSDPVTWATSFKPTFKVISDKGYRDVLGQIRAHPDFDKMVAGKLELPGITDKSGGEFFLSDWPQRIPILGHVPRVAQNEWDAWLGMARSTKFSKMVGAIESKGGPLDVRGLKVAGQHVNTISGSGQWNVAKFIAGSKANPLFAAKYWSSLWETFNFAPGRAAIKYGHETGDWRVFRYIAKDYAKALTGAAAGAGAMTYAGKELASYEFVYNPTDTDFGRLRKMVNGRKVTLDVLPEQIKQPLRFLAQMAIGRTGADGKLDTSFRGRGTTMEGLIEGKAAPVPKAGLLVKDYYASGKPQFGKTYDLSTAEGWLNLANELGAPISTSQAFEVAQSPLSPLEKALWLSIAVTGRGPNIGTAKPGLFSDKPDTDPVKAEIKRVGGSLDPPRGKPDSPAVLDPEAYAAALYPKILRLINRSTYKKAPISKKKEYLEAERAKVTKRFNSEYNQAQAAAKRTSQAQERAGGKF